jgi:hypothetical protein
MAMLKGKAFQVKMVDETPTPYHPRPKPANQWTPETVNHMTRETLKSIALAIAGVYVVKVLVDTSSEIALNKTTKKK